MQLHSILQVGLGMSVWCALRYRRWLSPVFRVHPKLCACTPVVPSPSSRKAPGKQSILTFNQYQADVITLLLVGCSGRAGLGLRGLYHGWLRDVKAA